MIGWHAIQDDDLSALDAVLATVRSPDDYASSIGYFAITGRKGLWLLEKGAARMVVCRHPNIDEAWLAFPAFGHGARELEDELLRERPEIRLGRVVAQAHEGRRVVSEEVLDWRYPVHTISTRNATSLEGGPWRKTRSRVRGVERRGVSISILSVGDGFEALALADRWVDTQDQGLSLADYHAPYERAFELLQRPELRLSGIAVRQDSALIGFHVWERPRLGRSVACSLCLNASRDIPGLSEYIMHASAKRLLHFGFEELCLGGSETASLDAYKRKFYPVRSVTLSSMVIADRTSRDDLQAA